MRIESPSKQTNEAARKWLDLSIMARLKDAQRWDARQFMILPFGVEAKTDKDRSIFCLRAYMLRHDLKEAPNIC